MIVGDEYVEVTPQSIRLSKKVPNAKTETLRVRPDWERVMIRTAIGRCHGDRQDAVCRFASCDSLPEEW